MLVLGRRHATPERLPKACRRAGHADGRRRDRLGRGRTRLRCAACGGRARLAVRRQEHGLAADRRALGREGGLSTLPGGFVGKLPPHFRHFHRRALRLAVERRVLRCILRDVRSCEVHGLRRVELRGHVVARSRVAPRQLHITLVVRGVRLPGGRQLHRAVRFQAHGHITLIG